MVYRNGILAGFPKPQLAETADPQQSTIITSLLGFVFWRVAARLVSPTDVGVASAVLSASQLVAYVCIFGLGTLTIAELAHTRVDARRLLGATTIATGVAGLATGFEVPSLLRTSWQASDLGCGLEDRRRHGGDRCLAGRSRSLARPRQGTAQARDT